MVDIVDHATRSRMMSGIRSKNTKPEMLIRLGLHGRGFRYRLHCKELPGKPDFCLPKFRAAVFVNGCFWHGHDCPLFKWPSTRPEFWKTKIGANRNRDLRAIEALQARGWRTAIVWECAFRKHKRSVAPVVDVLGEWIKGDAPTLEIRA